MKIILNNYFNLRIIVNWLCENSLAFGKELVKSNTMTDILTELNAKQATLNYGFDYGKLLYQSRFFFIE